MNASEYFRNWQASRAAFLRSSTFEAETIYITRHIAPYFEHKNLEDIRPADIQAYVTDKLKSGRSDGKPGGLSQVSVKKHLSVIRHALRDAVIMGYINHSPAEYIRLPRRKSALTPRTVFLTADNAQRLLNVLEGSEIYPAVVLALYYGLRRSEVLGIKWDAVDFSAQTIEIRHTVVKNLTIEASDNTKTENSRRTYRLTPELKDLLASLREDEGAGLGPGGYIFHRTDGSPMRPDTLTRSFQKALARAGLAKMRFHDLRHSTASILFDQGWSLEDVKEWLGHTDIETTSNIYLHYTKQRRILLSDNLNGLFKLNKKEGSGTSAPTPQKYKKPGKH